MGIFDGKEGGIFNNPFNDDDEKAKDKSSDFSDTTSVGSSGTPGTSGRADFSDVTMSGSSNAPAVPSSGSTYTVKSGDSLSKIAKRLYGDASKWHGIYDANRDKIENPDLIHPGQELTIPDA